MKLDEATKIKYKVATVKGISIWLILNKSDDKSEEGYKIKTIIIEDKTFGANPNVPIDEVVLNGAWERK